MGLTFHGKSFGSLTCLPNKNSSFGVSCSTLSRCEKEFFVILIQQIWIVFLVGPHLKQSIICSAPAQSPLPFGTTFPSLFLGLTKMKALLGGSGTGPTTRIGNPGSFENEKRLAFAHTPIYPTTVIHKTKIASYQWNLASKVRKGWIKIWVGLEQGLEPNRPIKFTNPVYKGCFKISKTTLGFL